MTAAVLGKSIFLFCLGSWSLTLPQSSWQKQVDASLREGAGGRADREVCYPRGCSIPINKKSGKTACMEGQRAANQTQTQEGITQRPEAKNSHLGGTWKHWASRNTVRKAETQMELNLARDDTSNKKGFYMYKGDKKKTGKMWSHCSRRQGDIVTQDMEKAEVENVFASAFTSKTDLRESQVPETRGKGWNKEDIPLVEKDQGKEYLSKLDIHKSMGLDGMHPWAQREPADGIARLLSLILNWSWWLGEKPKEWRKRNVFRKGKKDDLGNYRLVKLPLIPGKVMSS